MFLLVTLKKKNQLKLIRVNQRHSLVSSCSHSSTNIFFFCFKHYWHNSVYWQPCAGLVDYFNWIDFWRGSNDGGSTWVWSARECSRLVGLMGNVHIRPVLWGLVAWKICVSRQRWDWLDRLDVEEWRFDFVGAVGVAVVWQLNGSCFCIVAVG